MIVLIKPRVKIFYSAIQPNKSIDYDTESDGIICFNFLSTKKEYFQAIISVRHTKLYSIAQHENIQEI